MLVLVLIVCVGSILVFAKQELLSKKSTVVNHKNLVASEKVGVLYNLSNSYIIEAGNYVYEPINDYTGVANNLDISIPVNYKRNYYFDAGKRTFEPRDGRDILKSEEEIEQELKDELSAQYVSATTARDRKSVV